MIDSDLIEELNETQLPAVKSAIATLASTGILESQLDRMFLRLSEGAYDQNPDDLAKEIADYRWRASGLRALQQLGESFLEEMKR